MLEDDHSGRLALGLVKQKKGVPVMVFQTLVRPIVGALSLAAAPFLLALAVSAQTAPPAPGQAPAAGQIEPVPGGPAPAPAAKPSPDSGYGQGAEESTSDNPASPPGSSAAAKGTVDPLVGLEVVSNDGKKVGEVMAVKAGPDGKLREIHVKTGSFLGFGGRTVSIPADMVSKQGEKVSIAMPSSDIGKLPKLEVQG
jgi:sporulation protein YlmC with PRC-barrel domain